MPLLQLVEVFHLLKLPLSRCEDSSILSVDLVDGAMLLHLMSGVKTSPEGMPGRSFGDFLGALNAFR